MKNKLSKLLSLVLAAMLSCGLLMGCSGIDRTALTSEEFKTIIEEHGYEVVDVIDQFADYDHIDAAYVATHSVLSYQIEFYQISDDKTAERMFESNVEMMEKEKDSYTSKTSFSLGNYEKYTFTTNEMYESVVRIGDTLIYCNVAEEYGPYAKEMIELLGY